MFIDCLDIWYVYTSLPALLRKKIMVFGLRDVVRYFIILRTLGITKQKSRFKAPI